jgi:signal transduction histidine kinase
VTVRFLCSGTRRGGVPTATNDGVEIAYEIDGPGIPEDRRDRVLEAGYSTAENGTGLGLDIVREIAEAHGWEITVTESETGGARFDITGVTVVSPDE